MPQPPLLWKVKPALETTTWLAWPLPCTSTPEAWFRTTLTPPGTVTGEPSLLEISSAGEPVLASGIGWFGPK